jgi:hypothetical protein
MQDLSFAIGKKQEQFNRGRDSSQLVSTDRNKFLVSTDISTGKTYDNDQLFEMLTDLVNPQYRAWYCGLFYKLGKERVLRLASVARADAKTNPRGYFSKLLKTEAKNI